MRMTLSDKRQVIDLVMLDLKKISQAPSMPGYMDWPDHSRAALQEKWAENERNRLYKAVDVDGNIWLIQNPESWAFRTEQEGIRVYRRPRARFAMSYPDAIREISGKGIKSGKAEISTGGPLATPSPRQGSLVLADPGALIDEMKSPKRKRGSEDPRVEKLNL